MGKFPLIIIAATLLLGCTKTTNITNNVPVLTYPGFTVQGLTDITISRVNDYAAMAMSVVYHDSIQEKVTLEMSPMPDGIILDDNWTKSAYPTFSNQLNFLDTNTLNPAIPGTYPITLKATGLQSGTKTYTFNIIVNDIPSVTDTFIGIYPNCMIQQSGVNYSDTLVKDANITNKVWFKNFGNTGKAVAAIFKLDQGIISIQVPPQTVLSSHFYGNGRLVTSGSTGYRLRLMMHIDSATVYLNM